MRKRKVRSARSSRRELQILRHGRRTGRLLACDTHGRLVWQQHICCAACERVYQTTDETAPNYAPELCVCGARLHPADDPAVEFAARPICPRCYAERLRAARGAA